MTLPGGAAAKIGNRYETWWTLSEFVRMLRGDTEAIHLEVPGIDKAEFVVTTGARRELHQAKRSHPSGKWSLATLRADGLLQAIGRQLADNTERFVFASGSDARELSDLCDAARHAESEDEFERDFLAAKDRKANFEKLLNCWACDLPTTVERLRRIEVHSIDERELERQCDGVCRHCLSRIRRECCQNFGRSLTTPCTAQSPSGARRRALQARFFAAPRDQPGVCWRHHPYGHGLGFWTERGGGSFSNSSSRARRRERCCHAWERPRRTAS